MELLVVKKNEIHTSDIDQTEKHAGWLGKGEETFQIISQTLQTFWITFRYFLEKN